MCTQIIKSNYPDNGWVSIVVDIFVIVSVTVSFLTMGAGMKHMGKRAYFSLVKIKHNFKTFFITHQNSNPK